MQNDRPFKLVGVTGGIGSGKSTVCRCFEALGRLVLRADDIARDLTEREPVVREAIRKEFGGGVFRADGSLDRPGLAKLAFASEEATERLNAIVHPKVFEQIDRTLNAEPVYRTKPYVVIEAALVYESGMDDWLDLVVVVDAPEDERIRRVLARDKTTREEILKRIAVQLPVKDKLVWADFVIVNDRNSVSLDAKVRLVDALICALPLKNQPTIDSGQ